MTNKKPRSSNITIKIITFFCVVVSTSITLANFGFDRIIPWIRGTSPDNTNNTVILENGDSSSINSVDSNNITSDRSYTTSMLNGFWDIKLEVKSDTEVYKTGEVRYLNVFWLAFLKQKDNEFKGYIYDGSKDICKGKDGTDLSGFIEGKTLTWKVKYTGKCCFDAEMNFKGEFIGNNDKIVGKLEREKNKDSSSKDRCTLFTDAEFVMKPSGS